MRIAICDDEAAELERLFTLLEKYESNRDRKLSVLTFQSAIDLLACVKGGEFDVVLLDVLMPGLSGIQAARELRELDKDVRILFLTSSPEFAVESYAVDAYHYLLKPATERTLFPLLDKVHSTLHVKEEESLVIKGKDGFFRVPFSQLEYVEVFNKTLSFHLCDSSTHELSAPLSDFEEEILSHPEFIKAHRSYILNVKQIQLLKGKAAITKAGHKVPVARTMLNEVKETYLRLLFQGQPENGMSDADNGETEPAYAEGLWRIMLVDDQPEDLAVWSARLRERGCIVETARSGREARQLTGKFDCILLDVRLSDGDADGFQLCRSLSDETGVPVIFLSCLTDAASQTRGFASGGIDFITKNTPVDLFWAKVETRIRLARSARTQMDFEPLRLDVSKRKGFMEGEDLLLTPTEFDLLWALAEHAPNVYTPEGIYQAVWGSLQWDGGQTVQVHMSRLRRKLEKAYPRHYFLETVWGSGYRFVPVAKAEEEKKG